MHWIAAPEKDATAATLETRLWDAADQLRANSGLKAQEYSAPILGLIFLRFAEVRFSAQRARLASAETSARRAPRIDDPIAYHAAGVLYLTPDARFDHLLTLPEGADIGASVNAAMRAIEQHNPPLAGVLPKSYTLFTAALLKELLRKVAEIPASVDFDAFGRIYEYFLGEFARSEGQKGGEFYTPSSIVKLLTEVIEPFHGRILDPACGSGGMFVQSARFVAARRHNPAAELAICGVEKTDKTGRLCRLNLAVHGLEGDIRHGGNVNSYYDDPHAATGHFDFVLANPPFNVNAVDKERLKEMVGAGRRFPFGLPRTDNANYLWIQLFYSSLNARGRAGFVMANSAADARLGAGAAPAVDRQRRGGGDGSGRPQLLLHGDAALHALVSGQRQGGHAARRPRALYRRPPPLPPGGSGAPRMGAGADRLSRQPGAPLSRRPARLHPGRRGGRSQDQGSLRHFFYSRLPIPYSHLQRRARTVQGGHARGDRSAGLVAQPRALRGRGAGRDGER